MKAVVFHGVGDIRLDTVKEPSITVKEPSIKDDCEAIVRLTASAICGTDLLFVRGTVPGMQEGTILGHEGVGVVEEVGKAVRNVKPGDRAVIASTIACGACSYCRAGYYAQCDNANPNSKLAGTPFFRRSEEYWTIRWSPRRIRAHSFANVGLVKLPEEVTDDQLSSLPTFFRRNISARTSLTFIRDQRSRSLAVVP